MAEQVSPLRCPYLARLNSCLPDRKGVPEAAHLPECQSSRCVKSFVRLCGVLISRVGGKKISTKEKRWYKDVGLGFKTPAEAISGSYIGVCRLVLAQNHL